MSSLESPPASITSPTSTTNPMKSPPSQETNSMNPLRTIYVKDLPFNAEVIEINEGASFRHIVTIMAQAEISSVPVYCLNLKKYLGFVEIKDIVKMLSAVSHCGTTAVRMESELEINNYLKNAIKSLTAPGDESFDTISKIARSRPFQFVYNDDASLYDVVLLLKNNANFGRIPVLDRRSGKITKIISQSDVIHHLAFHSEMLNQDLLKIRIQDIHIASFFKPVVTVNADDYAFNALSVMALHRFAAIPVIKTYKNLGEGGGDVVDTFSEKDVLLAFQALLNDDFNLGETSSFFTFFTSKVTDFLHAVRTNPKKRRFNHYFATAVSATPHDKLAYVLYKLAQTRLHRLYIMNIEFASETSSVENLKGVISLIDIINLLF